MPDHTEVAIVGAGPYGLSLAAHLRAAGVEHRIFGHTMESWRNRMPPGMVLKSHGWSSNLSDPAGRLTLAAHCAEHGLPYHDSLLPTPLATFAAYGESFQRRLVPHVEARTLVRLDRLRAGFRARFDDGGEVTANRVVLAVGVHPFATLPPALRGLPGELVSHSGDHGALDGFRGRRVAVLGSGASATDLAALLVEAGASATLVARSHALTFAKPPTQRSLARRLVRPFRAAVSPSSGIGRGWALKICADAPALFHGLPEKVRHAFVKRALGPLGTASMRERLFGRAPILLGRTLEHATAAAGGRVVLDLAGPDGARERLEADHVVAATGYDVDLRRLTFLSPDLLAAIAAPDGKPALSLAYETTAPGLHVIGPASAFSFGPVCRFVFGAPHPARAIAGRLAGRRASASDRVPSAPARAGAR